MGRRYLGPSPETSRRSERIFREERELAKEFGCSVNLLKTWFNKIKLNRLEF